MWVIALSLDGWWVDHAHGPALAILSLLCWHRPKLQGMSASLKHVIALASDFLALSLFPSVEISIHVEETFIYEFQFISPMT